MDLIPIHMYFKEVAVLAGHQVLLGVEDNSMLIVGDPQGILGQQVNTHPNH
jgi:hypothetical protein